MKRRAKTWFSSKYVSEGGVVRLSAVIVFIGFFIKQKGTVLYPNYTFHKGSMSEDRPFPGDIQQNKVLVDFKM